MYVVSLNKTPTRALSYSAICLALCLALPFLTGQIPQIGRALSPMHLPVLLCGFLCGPWWALGVGAVAPVLRNLLFGMPSPLYPTCLAMSFELLTYGLVSGLLYRRTRRLYPSLIAAMLSGRIVWGIAMTCLLGLGGNAFGWAAFLAGAFTGAVPGIIVQLILIPLLVLALQKAKLTLE